MLPIVQLPLGCDKRTVPVFTKRVIIIRRMKKNRIVLIFAVLMMAISMSCCSSEDNYDFVELSSFFRTEFSSYDKMQKPFDFKNNLSNDNNPCIIINSKEEFEKAYKGGLTLPAIDFSKYTLIIGKIFMGAGTFIDNLDIKQINDNKASLAIHCITDTKGGYIDVMYDHYYWELFPKFHASEIEVETNREFGEVDDKIKHKYEL